MNENMHSEIHGRVACKGEGWTTPGQLRSLVSDGLRRTTPDLDTQCPPARWGAQCSLHSPRSELAWKGRRGGRSQNRRREAGEATAPHPQLTPLHGG